LKTLNNPEHMKKILCGNEMDKLPNWGFKVMAFLFNIGDFFMGTDKRLDPFKIQNGQTVIDYGSGTGRYLRKASELVDNNGIVYAVDIHELAIESAFRLIKKYDLKNVKPILTDGKSVALPSHIADCIYALDMFHMVKDPLTFLKELNRLIKNNGVLYIEDGHQSRYTAKDKILKSGFWEIVEENKAFITCKPKNQ